MTIVLFDPIHRDHFYPFSATRALSQLRMGILTMQERWEKMLGSQVFTHTINHLQALYPQWSDEADAIWVNATVFPSAAIIEELAVLQSGQAWMNENGLIAVKGKRAIFSHIHTLQQIPAPHIQQLEYAWQLMQWNDAVLRADFELITAGRTSAPISVTNKCTGAEHIFLEAGVSMEHAIINASTGPVYIGKNATVMEGTAIRGPFAMGEGSVLKLCSRMYGATTLGPYCMGGGEIKNSILMGYSNKAHDGYMGDSIIGEWCNWGAGTSNSNLKNSGGMVKVWNEALQNYIEVGNKCGVLMGDYSRTAIQTAINTGTVIGVSCNVFGPGLLPTRITDFSWGVSGEIYRLETALKHIANWKSMKGHSLAAPEQQILTALHTQAATP